MQGAPRAAVAVRSVCTRHGIRSTQSHTNEVKECESARHKPLPHSRRPGVLMMTVNGPFVIIAKPVGPICNLECEHCDYLDKTKMFSATECYRMSPDVLEAYVVALIEACPGPASCISYGNGGEPTMAEIDFYSRAVELQRRRLPAGWTCLKILESNSTLVDERWAAFLAKNKFVVEIRASMARRCCTTSIGETVTTGVRIHG